MSKPCEFIKPGGEPCKAYALLNLDYCFWHNPESASKRALAQKTGGQNRSAGKQSNRGRYSIKTADDIAKALEDALNDACGLENSHARARTIGYLCQISLKALEIGALEERLEALEGKVFNYKQARSYRE